MHVSILSRRYSSSRSPYARRWMTRILLLSPSTKPSADLVLGFAVGGNPIPMTIDHLGELLVRLQALPLEARAPVLEEPPGPALAFVAPHLAEGLLEQVGGVQSLVRGQQGLQGLAAIQVQVLAVRQQGVLLPLDVTPLLAREPGVLAFA